MDTDMRGFIAGIMTTPAIVSIIVYIAILNANIQVFGYGIPPISILFGEIVLTIFCASRYWTAHRRDGDIYLVGMLVGVLASIPALLVLLITVVRAHTVLLSVIEMAIACLFIVPELLRTGWDA